MRATLTLAALVSVLASSAAAQSHPYRIELEYYKTHNCTGTTISAVFLEPSNGCFNLTHPSRSFHVGGPSTEAQVKPGCVLRAYGQKSCHGHVFDKIVGPSDAETCYATDMNGPTIDVVNSVQEFCAGAD